MENSSKSEWKSAVSLLSEWEKGSGHLDELLDSNEPGRARWLVMEVFRNWLGIERTLGKYIRRQPRPLTKNLMKLAVGELLFREREKHPAIIHHAVEVGKAIGLSKSECGFVNGVLRAIERGYASKEPVDLLATHPEWLVRRWIRQFGDAAVLKLLEWNQAIPRLTIRAMECPAYARPSKWNGYYILEEGKFAESLADLQRGKVYIQDPFTRIPVELLAPEPGEFILDLCAAPGGKTRLLSEWMSGTGHLIAVDKPGKRFDRLRENTELLRYQNIQLIGDRVENLDTGNLSRLTGKTHADALLIDVPCSNTGVIQKRPDVKLKIEEDSIPRHAEQQTELLHYASTMVRPGGRLVYSTCSIEEEENMGVIESFLAGNSGWQLAESINSYPWECEHDGGGAFLLTKTPSK